MAVYRQIFENKIEWWRFVYRELSSIRKLFVILLYWRPVGKVLADSTVPKLAFLSAIWCEVAAEKRVAFRSNCVFEERHFGSPHCRILAPLQYSLEKNKHAIIYT